MQTDKQVKLRIDNISLSFGGVNALVDVSMEIRDNEILAVIGPNGAGLNAIYVLVEKILLKEGRCPEFNGGIPF